MSLDGIRFPVSLYDHLEPPAGLSEEWDQVYRILAAPLGVVDGFFSNSDAHQLGLESLVNWHDTLDHVKAAARDALLYLHGRAQSTWTAGHAILNAVWPIEVCLRSTIQFLAHPLPAQSNGRRLTSEEQAASSRARLAELKEFDGRSLLLELAAAVTNESQIPIRSELLAPMLPATATVSGRAGADGTGKHWAPIAAAARESLVDEPAKADAPLSELQYDLLDALRKLKATDAEKRKTGAKIAEKVGGTATAESVKAPLSELKVRGLVDSKTGRNGGTWLTRDGLELIERLRP